MTVLKFLLDSGCSKMLSYSRPLAADRVVYSTARHIDFSRAKTPVLNRWSVVPLVLPITKKSGKSDHNHPFSIGVFRFMPIKRDPDNTYFPLNSKIAQDRSLSYAARGILIELLSRPVGFSMNLSDLKIICERENISEDQFNIILYKLEIEGFSVGSI